MHFTYVTLHIANTLKHFITTVDTTGNIFCGRYSSFMCAAQMSLQVSDNGIRFVAALIGADMFFLGAEMF